jgi:MFS family permease
VNVAWLLGLAFVGGVVGSVEIPARQALMIDLVGRDDLRDAIALNSSGFNLARIVGPAFAAGIIANLGIAWCFAVNAISYLTVLIGLSRVALPRWHPPRLPGAPLQEIRDGVTFALRSRTVRILLELITVMSILGIPYIALMPVLARDQLGLDASGYGLMLSVLGIGGLVGALGLAAVGPRVGRGRALAGTSSGYALLLVLLSLVRSPALAYPLLFGTGCLMIVTNALANGLLQTIVPDEYRGRLMSMYSLIVVGLPQVIGAFSAGAVARVVGVSWAVGTAATVMLLYGLFVFRRHPELRDL